MKTIRGIPMISDQLGLLLTDYYALSGILACLIVIAALIIPSLLYTGRAGERYSLLNHFVSELGEAGVSRAAGIFNGGLIAAGLLFIPFDIGLGLAVPNFWAKLGMIAGIITAVSLILIGIFSMDKIKPHIAAALTFFDSGLATILLFTIAVWNQPAAEALPRGIIWIGIVCILIYIGFLSLSPRLSPDTLAADFLRVNPLKNRPKIWITSILEWLVVVVTTLWYLSTALISFFHY